MAEHQTDHYHRDPEGAFNNALKRGALSDIPDTPSYAGRFMYMYSGTRSERRSERSRFDAFKHIETRKYTFVSF